MRSSERSNAGGGDGPADGPSKEARARLALRRVSKSFPGVLANDAVSFSVAPGEIHALLGENGAGKSTLVKMIYGVLAPDAGEIFWNGAPVAVPSPKAARALGVGMVFQHFSLFDALTVAENIALGLDVGLKPATLDAKIREVLDAYGLALDPKAVVGALSVGERQRIEVVRALLATPQLLIMDEPTSVLTPQEADQLFRVLRQLAAEGCSILYISHKLGEIQALCDKATILRGGKVVAECDPKTETAASMAQMMIGGDLKAIERRPGRAFGDDKLAVRGLSSASGGVALAGLDLTVRTGEIFGVAGVAGNGQNELLSCLSGETAVDAGEISLNGADVARLGPSARRARGLCALPEERHGHAAVSDFSLAENATLTGRIRRGLAFRGFVDAAAATRFAEEIIERFGVKARGAEALAGSLSGGNLQKFVIGREILQAPDVLVVSQPTWGVDAGAAATIHQALMDLAAEGAAILLISQDLDELLAIADTLAVINEGALSAPMAVGEASIEEIGLLMGGIHGAAAAAPALAEGAPDAAAPLGARGSAHAS